MSRIAWSASVRNLLVVRRPRWGLTRTGTLIALVTVGTVVLILARGLCSFLSVTSPVGGQVLVVEGWMPAYAFREAAAQFRARGYANILATTVVDEDADEGRERSELFGQERLIGFGVPRERVVTVLTDQVARDRTFHSALAVEQWLREQPVRPRAIDILTLGPHARRSRLLFEKALGSDTAVGVIAVNDRKYDAQHWWRSNEGMRAVLTEAIGYVYARIVFSWPL